MKVFTNYVFIINYFCKGITCLSMYFLSFNKCYFDDCDRRIQMKTRNVMLLNIQMLLLSMYQGPGADNELERYILELNRFCKNTIINFCYPKRLF